MYAMILVACVTLLGETHCQSFERDHQFNSAFNCQVAAAIDKGRYADRIERRKDWLTYDWQCQPVTVADASSRQPTGLTE
ncbi:hypothetical protein HH303_16850 [Rhodospirillaceae bacterium KN72]|uniref:Uncharacterized protein n=1 Tax=Pacificispira spongiicola TaxID=2729598 RepID=A0A7Y0HGZ2_9PROT|nr:hypothetical protein [Pacificispira spongiicola]NMM46163.1 hypothetical protein [Pacificispira spongiicola]